LDFQNFKFLVASQVGGANMHHHTSVGWQKSHRPLKTDWWDSSMVICLERNANLHKAQLMPFHSLSLAPENPDWFCLSGTGSSW